MKSQWESISEAQEDHFSAFRERKVQIEKDVHRTDRTQSYFEGDNNPNLIALKNILMTYVMFNFDLGYVQVSNGYIFSFLVFEVICSY